MFAASLGRRVRRAGLALVVMAAAPAALVTLTAAPAGAADVDIEAEFRAAFGSATETTINLFANIDLTDCGTGPAFRPLAAVPLTINGNGFRIRQTCAENNVLFTQGLGLTINNTTLDGGNNAVNGQSAGSLTLNNTNITGVTSATSGATAIFSLGAVTLNGSSISGTSSSSQDGGGIGAVGSITLDNSTIAQTSGTTGATGIATFGPTPISLTNSSVIDTTTSGGGAQGVNSTFGGTIDLTTSQVVGTSSPGNTSGIITVNGGKTTLTDSSVLDTSGNTTNGITGTGDVELNRSTIARATGEVDTAAIVMLDGNTLLVNSTLSNNTAGIAGLSGDEVTMVYSDVVSNGGVEGGTDPAQVFSRGDLTSFGSVIALATGAGVVNCQVSSTDSIGYNWADDDTCDFLASTDTEDPGGNPQLSALGENGGPTETRLPLTGSPLIDAIPPADCGDGDTPAGFAVTTDQRSVTRPQFAGCDIGSVEVAPEPPVPPGPGPGPGPAGPAEPVAVTPRFTG